ncbi:MAG TPA: histidine kinase [Saprospiraceae bacterium]|nr:histidine kinase [Saprospiraceae bacterium]HNM24939.1 histidine kinase [Saprospiraceae bacterium]
MESGFQASEIFFFVGAGILIMIALALVVVAYTGRAQRRILMQRMQAQAAELRHQEELVRHNLTTQEEERKRIAGNLHDDIGSKLGVLHLTFHRLRRTEAGNDQYSAMCEEIDSLIATTLDTTRRISHELLPPTLEDFGLLEALQELCESIRKTGALDVQLDLGIERNELGGADNELHLFRIVQELCNNTLKYAQASRIDIKLRKTARGRQLHYRDDGQGFDPENIKSRGLGMKNLESRAKTIGGVWKIHTAPGQGFEASVDF